MIINIRGTSGSGKTTLVRAVLERNFSGSQPTPHLIPKRKRPIMSTWQEPVKLAVLGHYETACGGCDTITKLDQVFDQARQASKLGYHVLMEGLLLSGEFARTAALAAEEDLRVVVLTTNVNDCVANVEKRRLARGDERPLDPTNTVLKDKTVRRVAERLEAEGVEVSRVLYDRALEIVETLLGVR